MHVEELDLTDPAIASDVLTLQKAAYQIEADLIGSTDIPPLHETVEELMGAPLHWLGVSSEGRLVAALAYTGDDKIDIDRLVVAPDAMRRGFGSALLDALDATVTTTVSTGTRNHPARAFYRSHGFVECGETTPVPGVTVTHFVRRPN